MLRNKYIVYLQKELQEGSNSGTCTTIFEESSSSKYLKHPSPPHFSTLLIYACRPFFFFFLGVTNIDALPLVIFMLLMKIHTFSFEFSHSHPPDEGGRRNGCQRNSHYYNNPQPSLTS